MSATTAISSSTSASYATRLAQTSALKRTLSNLGAAVQRGDMTSANAILTAFIKANPQYATSASNGTASQDPINQDFQALANAISSNQTETARSAWARVQSDLAKDWVTNLSSGPSATVQLLAQTKASLDQQVISDMFGTNPGGDLSVTAFLGGSAASSSGTGLSSSLIANWLTYQSGGNAASAAGKAGTGQILSTAG